MMLSKLLLASSFVAVARQNSYIDLRPLQSDEMPAALEKVIHWLEQAATVKDDEKSRARGFSRWARYVCWQAAATQLEELRPSLREIALWRTDSSYKDYRLSVTLHATSGLWAFHEPPAFFESLMERFAHSPVQVQHAMLFLSEDPSPSRLERFKQVKEALVGLNFDSLHAEHAIRNCQVFLDHGTKVEVLPTFEGRVRYLLKLAPGNQQFDTEEEINRFLEATALEDSEGNMLDGG